MRGLHITMTTVAPPNTSRSSRLNALQHGILAREALICTGDAAESEAEFDALDTAIRDQTSPEGALEQLLVEQLIQLTWRWRRVIRYENSAIRAQCRESVEKIHSAESFRDDSTFYGVPASGNARDLDAELRELDADLPALDARDPFSVRPLITRHVLASAQSKFGVRVEDVLALNDDWENEKSFSSQQVNTLVKAVCRHNGISRSDYWSTIRARVARDHERLVTQIARREARSGVAVELSTVPDTARRFSIQRYEAHISRQFYRALHELQRLQSARGSQPSEPPPSPGEGPPPPSPLEGEGPGMRGAPLPSHPPSNPRPWARSVARRRPPAPSTPFSP